MTLNIKFHVISSCATSDNFSSVFFTVLSTFSHIKVVKQTRLSWNKNTRHFMHPLEIQPTTPSSTLIFINYKLRILSYLKFTQEYLIRNKRSSLPDTSLETPPRKRDNLSLLRNVFFVSRVFSDWVAGSNARIR